MGAPTIYKWSDVGAPNANGLKCVSDILDACLVTGYGTQTAAGWTKPFSGTDKAVFRNNSVDGTGMYLRVDQTTTNNYANIDCYETMSDVDNGLGSFAPNSCYIVTSSAANTVERCWMIIADNRCFYAIFWTGSDGTSDVAPLSSTLGNCTFFGDGIPQNEPDPYFYIAFGCSTSNLSSSYLLKVEPSYGYGVNQYAVPRQYTGETTNRGKIVGPGRNIGTIPGQYGLNMDSGYPRIIGRAHVADNAFFTIRGYMPGLWHTGNIWSNYDQFEEITIDGMDFLCIHTRCYSTQTVMMLDIGATFRP